MSSPAVPLFRFGIIADPQYAPIVPHVAMDRQYANSLAKVAEAVEVFNSWELSFVMTLGDDRPQLFKLRRHPADL